MGISGFFMKKTRGNAHNKNLTLARVKGSREVRPILMTEKFKPHIAVIRIAKRPSLKLILTSSLYLIG
jgi:hypothetical protein|tara:strand:- start:230 stop:433 length:204 start_codon:yes stop_codon:yes gene_type:complete